MTRASVGKKIGARSEYWRERIAEQERSGMSVQRFCEEQGLTEQSFYLWRKRLRKQQPMRFALVETEQARDQAGRARDESVTEHSLRRCSSTMLMPTLTERNRQAPRSRKNSTRPLMANNSTGPRTSKATTGSSRSTFGTLVRTNGERRYRR